MLNKYSEMIQPCLSPLLTLSLTLLWRT